MNRAELVDALAKDLDRTKVDCENFLSAFISTVSTNMKKKDGVKIIGFGTFKSAKRAARKGRNPATGEEIMIKARTVPVFKAGIDLRTSVKK